jgi:endonuclease YncB( thermonuclease family)
MRWALLLLGLAAHAEAAEPVTGKVLAVPNGDTLVIETADRKRQRIRLADIDAPERRQQHGAEARQSLADLCLKKEAKIDEGHVTCDGVDANAEQVKRGWAWVSLKGTRPRHALYELEAHARLRQLGLWAGESPVPPWEWRASRSKK